MTWKAFIKCMWHSRLLLSNKYLRFNPGISYQFMHERRPLSSFYEIESSKCLLITLKIITIKNKNEINKNVEFMTRRDRFKNLPVFFFSWRKINLHFASYICNFRSHCLTPERNRSLFYSKIQSVQVTSGDTRGSRLR